ncbi:MAG TPA: carbamoyl phosphate synthase small subunit [Elusimicrobia bacterium]|nr:carbamoyl phosphate synthase small subunit [Elusimicrobiota bacterium]
MRTPALLALEDNTVFRGFSFGAPREARGEIVFNTSMTGYQEVLTDPSYKGQLVSMTCPQIGNTGINEEDAESRGLFLEAFIVREACRIPSNWRSKEPLDAYLRRNDVPAIEGVDTRALTRLLREKGCLRAVLAFGAQDPKALVRRARAVPSTAGRDLVSSVTCERPYDWTEPLPAGPGGLRALAGFKPLVAALDFGVKRGILRCLVSAGCRVRVLPASATAEQVLALQPDGVLLSNGPGDPEPLAAAVETVKRLLQARVPLFGICLGHQLLGLALGGKTYKLKFGHHGANHPVQDLATGRIEITSQNHNFCVDIGSLPRAVRTTHVNLTDRTSEGLEHTQLPAFSVQYHPEASAGPHDARGLFTRFVQRMAQRRLAAHA